MPTYDTKNILLNILGSRHSLVMKLHTFMQYYNRNIFIKKSTKYGMDWCQGFFYFKKMLYKKEFKEAFMLILTYLGSFAITYPI